MTDKLSISKTDKGHLRLSLKVIPASREDKIEGLRGDRIYIRLTAPAVDGKANLALVSFLAKILKVKKTQVLLVSGEKSRLKLIELKGVSLDEASRILLV